MIGIIQESYETLQFLLKLVLIKHFSLYYIPQQRTTLRWRSFVGRFYPFIGHKDP